MRRTASLKPPTCHTLLRAYTAGHVRWVRHAYQPSGHSLHTERDKLCGGSKVHDTQVSLHVCQWLLIYSSRCHAGKHTQIAMSGLQVEPQLVFDTITFCVMPLYAMMIGFPKRKLVCTLRNLSTQLCPVSCTSSRYTANLFADQRGDQLPVGVCSRMPAVL